MSPENIHVINDQYAYFWSLENKYKDNATAVPMPKA